MNCPNCSAELDLSIKQNPTTQKIYKCHGCGLKWKYLEDSEELVLYPK